MRFWDTSALVPLVYPEASTERLLALESGRDPVLVWTLTPAEIASALSRKRREGVPEAALSSARRRLAELSSHWIEIQDVPRVRQRALRLVETHPLRAADALQLAAALVGAEEQTDGIAFVTLDRVLAEAARKEGFEVSGL